MPDGAERRRPALARALQRGGDEVRRVEPLVGVDVGTREQHQLGRAPHDPADRVPAERREAATVGIEQVDAGLVGEREVHVARRSHLGRVDAREEGRREPVLRCDLAREQLGQRGAVGSLERAGRLDRDLVLAPSHLGLDRLDRDARPLERPPERAEHRLVAVGSVDGVVLVGPVERLEPAVALRERGSVRVGVEVELPLDRRHRHESGRPGALHLRAEHRPRRDLDDALGRPREVGEHDGAAVEVRHRPERSEVGPRGHVGPAVLLADLREALVHVLLVVVDEDRARQVDPGRQLREEARGRDPLAHQLALQVRRDDGDAVDGTAGDGRAEFLESQHRSC